MQTKSDKELYEQASHLNFYQISQKIQKSIGKAKKKKKSVRSSHDDEFRRKMDIEFFTNMIESHAA